MTSLLPVFQQMLQGRILVPAGGANRFSLLHAEDLAGAVLHLIEQGLVAGGVNEIHDARDSGYSWAEFAAATSRLLDRRVVTQGLPRWPLSLFAAIHCTWARALGRPPMLTPGKVKEIYHHDWVAREYLLERATNWQPQIDLEEGFVRTLAWYKAHGWL